MKDKIIIPDGYKSNIPIRETEICIKFIKDCFEHALADKLNLTRVSAPLFVKPETGLNDNLSGVERPVSFGILEQDDAVCEIVHSLAKWKRLALLNYGFSVGEGLYTDMNAIRRDEITDNLHSIYVDQWDWERVIEKKDRNTAFLKDIVRGIYHVLLYTEACIAEKFGLGKKLPKDIAFVTTLEMENEYPKLSPKEREYEVAKRYGAVFIMQIGGKLKSGDKHDERAPDYDDWKLNGDIMLYYPLLDCAFELSSMGIRVDEQALIAQLDSENCMERLGFSFQRALADGKLPYTIGGGIGQSRLCMFLLNKAHIGEVQASVWPDEDMKFCADNKIMLL